MNQAAYAAGQQHATNPQIVSMRIDDQARAEAYQIVIDAINNNPVPLMIDAGVK